MLPEEEKLKIVEKITFENELKKSLSVPEETPKYSWLNSKISLLLIGALVTGILVPWFQFTQKTIEWKRQNQFDRINYQLEMMRDCIKNFVLLQAYKAEALERAKPYLNKTKLNRKEYDEFQKQFIEFQNKNFNQNAKVTSLIISFTTMNNSGDNKAAISLQDLFERYIKESTLFMQGIDYIVRYKFCTANLGVCKNFDQTKIAENSRTSSNMATINKIYSILIPLMVGEIKKAEKQNEYFLF